MTTNNALTALDFIWEDAKNTRKARTIGEANELNRAIETIRAALLDAPSCPMGDDCDLTIAYMKGAADEREKHKKDAPETVEGIEPVLNEKLGPDWQPHDPYVQGAMVGWNAHIAQSRQSAGVPDGWKIVPINPTLEMVDAGIANELTESEHKCGTVSGWNRMYKAMLEAAPQPPAGGVDVEIAAGGGVVGGQIGPTYGGPPKKQRGLIGQDLAAVREKIEGLKQTANPIANATFWEGHNEALDAVLALLKQGG